MTVQKENPTGTATPETDASAGQEWLFCGGIASSLLLITEVGKAALRSKPPVEQRGRETSRGRG